MRDGVAGIRGLARPAESYPQTIARFRIARKNDACFVVHRERRVDPLHDVIRANRHVGIGRCTIAAGRLLDGDTLEVHTRRGIRRRSWRAL